MVFGARTDETTAGSAAGDADQPEEESERPVQGFAHITRAHR